MKHSYCSWWLCFSSSLHHELSTLSLLYILIMRALHIVCQNKHKKGKELFKFALPLFAQLHNHIQHVSYHMLVLVVFWVIEFALVICTVIELSSSFLFYYYLLFSFYLLYCIAIIIKIKMNSVRTNGSISNVMFLLLRLCSLILQEEEE